MRCIVTTLTKGKVSNKMYFDDLDHGIGYMIQVLKNYNMIDKIYSGMWKKKYDVYANKYLYKEYTIITDHVTLVLYCRGSKEIDTHFFVEMIKAMEKYETF